ncbi:MAG TPA: nucleotide exchange factor GrpE [Jatrophihabitantaceae bacterium]|nr:nucleotide exchange factor GrpE [Jatrophihabitantaceae bacterium]
MVIRDRRKIDPLGDKPRVIAEETADQSASVSPLAEAEAQVAERTADLQRLSAEYSNYRKRVDRDRVVVGELATARVLESLLPVLDDIDRAEAHGDLNGAFKAVADQLAAVLQKLGLESFGAEGDAFDPGIHEAVMHDERADIAVPTTTTVMRRGYRVGDRLLRPAMVGVSDPATAGSDDEASDPDDELS